MVTRRRLSRSCLLEATHRLAVPVDCTLDQVEGPIETCAGDATETAVLDLNLVLHLLQVKFYAVVWKRE